MNDFTKPETRYQATGRSVHTQLAALISDIKILKSDPGPAHVKATARFSDRGIPVTIYLTLEEALAADIIKPIR